MLRQLLFQRQPLLQPGQSDLNGAGSARQTRSAHSGSLHHLSQCLSVSQTLFQRIQLWMNLNHLWSWCVFLPPDAQTVKRIGRLVMRRVCVPELDQRFSDMAETFNEQQERYEAMVRHIRNVRQTYGCNHNDTLALAECVRKIREGHGK